RPTAPQMRVAAAAWFANPGPSSLEDEELDAEPTAPTPRAVSPRLLLGAASLALLAMVFTVVAGMFSSAPSSAPLPAPVQIQARPVRVAVPAPAPVVAAP